MIGFANAEQHDGRDALQSLIRQDQLRAIRRNVLAGAPITTITSVIVLFVSVHHRHHGALGIEWFAAALVINCVRLGQCFLPVPAPAAPAVILQLRLFCVSALLSGLVWALLPLLCDGYTSPQTLFYLTVVCGVTAGAITHGTPYALMPSCMILPPLCSAFYCLLYAGGLDRNCLSVAILIYTAALLKFAIQSEADFREASRLKHDAVTLAQSLREAHAQAVKIAEEMRYRATHDELTNLLNRAGFMSEVEAHMRGTNPAFCLMLLDLDGFKSVNDAFGHHAGDRVLVEVARRLSETLPPAFTIGRLGGDEFAVFYDSSADDAFPAELAMRLITSIEVPFATFDAGRLGVCIGLYIGRGQNVTEVLTCADEALYAAKAAGRNKYYVFDDTLRGRLEMRRDIERDLQRAIADNALEVWYQPVFGTDGRELVSFEALLRWNHPRHGLVPSEEIIFIAATAGLAEPLLRLVFDDVCSMICNIRARGLEHVRVAMNISPREISRVGIDELILAGLKDRGCPASMFEIEMTEETVLDIRSVQDKLVRLSQGGVHITIDDFGVGYATLGMLLQPHINKIKIDRSFIKGISRSNSNRILVQSILNLGHSLDMQVVAEGVETEDDHALLTQIGCDLVQGYYYRHPEPAIAVMEWLESQEI